MANKDSGESNGFVKLDRKILSWEWWDDINTFRLFMTILLMANWEDKEWHGIKIKRGQLWTSIGSLSKKSGLTVRQTRTSLSRLISTNELTSETTKRGQLVTVVKYDLYQSDKRKATKQTTKKRADKRQRGDKQATITKEVKEVKELKEIKEQRGHAAIDLNELLSIEDINNLANEFQNLDSLLWEVEGEINRTGKKIRAPYSFVRGYARNVGWPVK